jgi:hypothetical protein
MVVQWNKLPQVAAFGVRIRQYHGKSLQITDRRIRAEYLGPIRPVYGLRLSREKLEHQDSQQANEFENKVIDLGAPPP